MHSQLVCWFIVLILVLGVAPFEGPGSVQAQVHPACASPNVCLPIGAVQGAVSDTVDGRTHRSPFAPPTGNSAGTEIVRIQGVIYQKTLGRTAAGANQFGFFIQNTAATADGNPLTSDGVFVFLGSFATVLNVVVGGPAYTPQVGDEIIMQGRVTEFFFLTEITSPRWVATVRTGVSIDAEVAAVEVNPPSIFADASRYWERREGMRVRIPADSLVVGSRDVFTSTMDGEIWVIRPDHPLASGRPAYQRRVFRDPHPLDDIPGMLFDNGNGFRIILGSLGIKAAAGDNNAILAPARTFDRLNRAAMGGVYFSFNKYQIMVDQQIALRPGPDPSANGPVLGFNPAMEVRIVTYNVENLYDFRDDPSDGCDFNGPSNTGCALETTAPVRPPFDYVPESQAAYEQKIRELAMQIFRNLHAPDIVLVQEAEDQDICSRVQMSLVCSGGDGSPDVLQDLAIEIERIGGPRYDAATDRDGADDRGIINAYLFKFDRVKLAPVDASHPVLGSSPTVVYFEPALGYNADVQNPKVLNAELPLAARPGADGTNVFTRPPQVALFRIHGDSASATYAELYILNNHFSSNPTGRVAQRREQAAYNAAIVAALQQMNLNVYAAVGGDLNVYPRLDDPSAPGELTFVSDQLKALYDAGLTNLWEVLVARDPAAAYSYVFEGQAQTLDQLFVTPSLLARLARVWASHINSDWPAEHGGDGPRGTSDHDPQGADFRTGP